MSHYPSPIRAWYALAVLTLAYVFSFIDRQILSLLVGPIRRDLQISDTQMSLLMGLSFALFYTICGFPIGRLADARPRRNIIVWGVITWSLFTAGCGLVASYAQLFLMRVGVGVGEAALSPPAYSMLSDYFPPERRAFAMSVYGLGIFVGAGLALVLGGIVVPYAAAGGAATVPLLGITVHPWQMTFFIVGLPGILVGALVATVREPARLERKSASKPVREVFTYIWRHRTTFGSHHVAASMMAMVIYATLAWTPTFFIRTHGWNAKEAGLAFGALVAVMSSLGILAGGWLCDHLARRGWQDAHFRVGVVTALLNLAPAVLYPLVSSPTMALVLLAPFTFLMSGMVGVAPAALHRMVPNEMRGQVIAMYLFAVALVGMGVGPTAVALLTDRVFQDDGMLRYSLAIVCGSAYLASALIWLWGRKPYCRSLERAD